MLSGVEGPVVGGIAVILLLAGWLAGARTARGLLSDSAAKLAKREQELRAQTERLEIGQRTARMIVMDWDIARDELTWSDSPEWLRGPLPASGKYPLYKDQVHADDRELFLVRRAEAIATLRADTHEYRFVRTDGRILWIYSQRVVLPGPEGKAARMLVALHDITERKEAQLALQRGMASLRESEERFRGLTELFASYFWEIDADLRFTMAHGPGLKDIGLRPEDLIGRRSSEVSPNWELVTPSRREFDALRAQRLPYHDILTRFRMPDGSYRYLSLWGQPRFSEDGRFLGYRGVTQDVTARITLEQEVRLLNETLERRVAARTVELEQANKELESFSYSVSHDLRAPLRAIAGFSAIVRKDFAGALPEQAQKRLQRIEQNALQMGRLIDNLLELARIGRASVTRAYVDMQALANESAQEFTQQANPRVQLEIGHLPPAVGDAVLLRQLWRNLVGNAVKFSRNAAEPRVEIGFEDSSIGAAYYVRDNGVGFDMQLAGNLFGAFQRLHAPAEFEGTGVGLAIVRRVVERHGGQVRAEAEPGKGATFRFRLDGR
ncbi:MAG TPA: ATP-binding protein [Burkholderiales bacterium]|nr:ATP-binding protein [Burkholderiales bacterium]